MRLPCLEVKDYWITLMLLSVIKAGAASLHHKVN